AGGDLGDVIERIRRPSDAAVQVVGGVWVGGHAVSPVLKLQASASHCSGAAAIRRSERARRSAAATVRALPSSLLCFALLALTAAARQITRARSKALSVSSDCQRAVSHLSQHDHLATWRSSAAWFSAKCSASASSENSGDAVVFSPRSFLSALVT